MEQAQPLRTAQHRHNAADEVALLANLPATNEGRILQNIMDAITCVETTLLAIEYNTQARLYNAGVSSSQQTLEGIRTPANVQPAGFPTTSSQLSSLSGAQLNALFAVYDLPIEGNLDTKRKRLRRFVGIMTDV